MGRRRGTWHAGDGRERRRKLGNSLVLANGIKQDYANQWADAIENSRARVKCENGRVGTSDQTLGGPVESSSPIAPAIRTCPSRSSSWKRRYENQERMEPKLKERKAEGRPHILRGARSAENGGRRRRSRARRAPERKRKRARERENVCVCVCVREKGPASAHLDHAHQSSVDGFFWR